jgi:hypothetical protein
VRLVLRNPRLRRGDHIKSVQVWVDGHRRRTARHHGELVITVPGRRAHLRVVWHTSHGQLITQRQTIDGCTRQHRRAAH